jgi:hypothetical protein
MLSHCGVYNIHYINYQKTLVRFVTVGSDFIQFCIKIFNILKYILTRFSTNTGYCNAEVGGRAGGRASTFGFRSITSSLLWPVDTKFSVYVAYTKRQLGIATQVSVIKVKVTVTKN